MRACTSLQSRQLLVVKYFVFQKASGQLDELIECSAAPVEFWECDSFYRAVSPYCWDPAKQTVTRHLPWDGALVELQHDSVSGNQTQIVWVR